MTSGTRGVPMFSFASREEHLRQRAARGWTEDEDVLVCIVEIDRLREARASALRDVREAVEALPGLTLGGRWRWERHARADDIANGRDWRDPALEEPTP